MSAAASTSIFGTLGSFLIVGALWGCTNPLLKLGKTGVIHILLCLLFDPLLSMDIYRILRTGSARVPEIQHDSAIKQFFCQLIATLTAWRVSRDELYRLNELRHLPVKV